MLQMFKGVRAKLYWILSKNSVSLEIFNLELYNYYIWFLLENGIYFIYELKKFPDRFFLNQFRSSFDCETKDIIRSDQIYKRENILKYSIYV